MPKNIAHAPKIKVRFSIEGTASHDSSLELKDPRTGVPMTVDEQALEDAVFHANHVKNPAPMDQFKDFRGCVEK